MENILPENETYDYAEQKYLNPEVSANEQLAFINNLRNLQQANTAQIEQDTRNLGTTVPTVQGGLTGAETYFKSRYQTPQANQLAETLRTAALQSQLNTALSNVQAQAKKRYNEAYSAYRKRISSYGNGGGSTGDSTVYPTTGGVEIETSDEYTIDPNLSEASGFDLPTGTTTAKIDNYYYTTIQDKNGKTKMYATNDPTYGRASDGYYYKKTSPGQNPEAIMQNEKFKEMVANQKK